MKRKLMALLVAAMMLTTLLPLSALAAGNEQPLEHTGHYACTHDCSDGTCSYVAAVEGVEGTEGTPCDFVCSEELAEDESCTCGHVCGDGSCSYEAGTEGQEAVEGTPCDHDCAAAGCTWVCDSDCPACAAENEGKTEEPKTETPKQPAANNVLGGAPTVLNVEKDEAVLAVEAMIAELPAADSEGRVLVAWSDEIEEANAAYNLLPEEKQALVDNYEVLENIVTARLAIRSLIDSINFKGYHESQIVIEVPYGTAENSINDLLNSLEVRVSYGALSTTLDYLDSLTWKISTPYDENTPGDYLWTAKAGKPTSSNSLSVVNGFFYLSWLSEYNPSATIPTVTVRVLPEELPEPVEALEVTLTNPQSSYSLSDIVTVSALDDGNYLVDHSTPNADGSQSYTSVKSVLQNGGALSVSQDVSSLLRGRIDIQDNVDLTLTIDHLNIKSDFSNRTVPALNIGSHSAVDLKVVGSNTLCSGAAASAINVGQGSVLTINGDTLYAANQGGNGSGIGFYDGELIYGSCNATTGTGFVPDKSKPNYYVESDYDAETICEYPTIYIQSGDITAVGHLQGAGIGGGTAFSGGNIIIEGTAHVYAKGGTNAAGIGGGLYGNGGNITIRGNAVVEAIGGYNAAGIGGGATIYSGKEDMDYGVGGGAGNITITGAAQVTATGGQKAHAIGRGTNSQIASGSITIDKTASVKAYAQGRSTLHEDSPKYEDFPNVHEVYTYAIDDALLSGTASILNDRFDYEQMPYNVYQQTQPNMIYVIPEGNPEAAIQLAMPHGGGAAPLVYSAFAATVPVPENGSATFLVRNDATGDAVKYARYTLKDNDRQFLYTVSDGMVENRDELAWSNFYTITATTDGNGSVSPAMTTYLDKGSNATFTFQGNTGYVVDKVTVDGEAVAVTGNTYTFANVHSNHTIHVTFKYVGGGYDDDDDDDDDDDTPPEVIVDPEIPLAQPEVPGETEEIADPEVPLANLPEEPATDVPEETVEENDVPLANLPKTGGLTGLGIGAAGLATILTGMNLRKKEK